MRAKMLAIIFVATCLITLTAKADNLILSAISFLDNGTFPILYTCDGKDHSPQLSWSHVPAKTKSLVLILSDPDAPSGIWYHWVVYNIPVNMTKLDEKINPLSLMVAKNSWDKAQYSGPCPPQGSTHHYIFTLYALDSFLSVPKEADTATILAAMQGHIIQKSQLTAAYSRRET